MTLSKSNEALNRLNQFVPMFITYNGTDKVTYPIDPNTGLRMDAFNPLNWMTYTDVVATGHSVGFVLTDNDPFFLIDVDHCFNGVTYDERATTVLNMFPGAAVELSQSGDGLHIMGRSGDLGSRKKRFDGYEVYLNNRIMTLGKQETTVGDIMTDCTATLNTWVPVDDTDNDAEWTTGPSEGWNGPADDLELIECMLNSSPSAQAAFGDKCTLRELWYADVPALSKAYPHHNDSKPYDASAADGALMGHLAFWTGKDCERMDRLFRQSGLMRDKWERKDYRKSTILGNVRRCSKVYNSPKQFVDVPDAEAAVATGAAIKAGTGFLDFEAQLKYFEGCVYIRDRHRVFVPDGGLLKTEQFRAVYGGYQFAMNADSAKPTYDAYECFTQSRVIEFPQAHDICFRPEQPVGAIIEEEGRGLLNSYVPANVAAVEGDITRFNEFMLKLFPDDRDREIILSYMAAVVQYKGVKFQWCPVIQGAEGNGKSLITSVVAYSVGWRYTHFPKAEDIANKFNAWVDRKLFIGIEEIHTGDKRETIDALKTLVTNSRIEIQGKGTDQVTGDNRANIIANTNHRDGMPIKKKNRRYSIFYTPQQDEQDLVTWGMDGDYFPDLYLWLRHYGGYAAVAHMLNTYKIADEFNPATHCHRAPFTSTTNEALAESAGRVEQLIQEAIDDGTLGFQGDWISSFALKQLLDSERIMWLTPYKRKQLLADLGYIPHPALSQGRSSTSIMQEGAKRSVLYVKKGSLPVNATSGQQATAMYIKAQGYINSGVDTLRATS